MPSIKTLKWIAWSICLAVFIAFGIRNLREPDLWWILRTGEWIVKHLSVPSKDVFSYTFQNCPWINIKWLYEVIAYGLQQIGGAEFILITQVIVNALFFLFTYKIYQQIRISQGKAEKVPTAGFIIASLIAVIGTEFRMTGRPEMISHLFALIYFYLFLKYRNTPGRFIFWLIPVQILWTNLHEAFGTGVVMIIGFMIADFIDRKYILKSSPQKNSSQKILYLATVLALLSVMINPRGWVMLLQPFNIFGQLNANKYTIELLPMYSAWMNYKTEIIISIFILLSSFYVFFSKESTEKIKFIFRPTRKFGSFYFVFFLLFFYLSFTATRNIPFFVYGFMPVLAYLIDNLISLFKKKKNAIQRWRNKFSPQTAYIILIIISLLFYFSVITNIYYKHFNPRERYGLMVAEGKNPVGVADYIIKNHLQGKCFSDYLVSSYLMWKLRPDFQTYIDLRDLDVFPTTFFNTYNKIILIPSEFEKADKKYHFRYVVLYRSKMYNLHRYLIKQPGWKFCYADAVSLLFEKNNIPDSLANYKDVFQIAQEPVPSKMAVFISTLFNPAYPLFKKEFVDYDLIASDIYYDLGNNNLALKYAKASSLKSDKKDISYSRLGGLYLNLAQDTSKASYLDSAYASFTFALKTNHSNPEANKGLAVFEMRNSGWKKAEKYLLTAKKNSQDDIEVYRMLARCQYVFSQLHPNKNEYYLKKWEKYLKKAYHINPEDKAIRYDLGTYYSNLNQCDKAIKYLQNLDYFPGMSDTDKQRLKFSKQNCGVE